MLGLFNDLQAVSHNLCVAVLEEQHSDMKIELQRIIKAVIEYISGNLASNSSVGKSASSLKNAL